MAGVDGLTLDQIRLFVRVADEGSFSAAARSLHRGQSAVSYGVAKLEELLGVTLFDRSGHRPVPTPTGQLLLADAREVLGAVGKLRTRAASAAGGLELAVSMAVDAIFPAELLIELVRGFEAEFPTVSLRIQTEVLEGVATLVLSGACEIGISGPVGADSEALRRRFLGHIAMIPVAAPTHVLAAQNFPLESSAARKAVQIVISQRAGVDSASKDRGVLSSTTWRVVDVATKLAMVRGGLGWGRLPQGMVARDIAEGRLRRLEFTEWGADPVVAALSCITRSDAPPGPAGLWLTNRLETLCEGGQLDEIAAGLVSD